MNFLASKLSTSAEWEKLARRFLGLWGDRGFGNLSQSKLEALLVYCLHTHGIIPADGVRIGLAEANALGKGIRSGVGTAPSGERPAECLTAA